MNTRALAAKLLTDVNSHGVSLTDALQEQQRHLSDKSEQAFLQELCYGVTRWWWRLETILRQLLQKPLKAKDEDIKHLAMVGVYQLEFMRVPDYAAVAETVNACTDLNKTWAKNLVNALLRNYQRRAEAIKSQVMNDIEAQYSHPAWLIKLLQHAWPERWAAILDANNLKPPMVLRVNLTKIQRGEYMEHLSNAGMTANKFLYTDAGLILDKPVPVEMLPGFSQGWVTVQDGAAQLAAGLLRLDSARRVLDACAAPGGTTTHLLESNPTLDQVVAVDIDAMRIKKIAENLQRLGFTANLTVGDAAQPASWWDNKLFDRILLDAPCSATGVIRRHPDIKLLRRPADIQQLIQLQRKILNAIWPLLESGGMLLYATCSVIPDENAGQIENFLQSHADATCLELSSDWGVSMKYGKQIFPGQDDMDGFYYACIQKQPRT